MDPKAGWYIPKTVVLSPELSEVLAIVPYAKGNEYEDLLVKEELGQFHLRTEEGRTVRIELQRLSRADQEYILNLKQGDGQ